MKTQSLLLVLFLTLLLQNTFAQNDSSLRTKHFNLSKKGLAIEGYDPVAYFTKHKAVKGKSEYSFQYKGITYMASSAENLALLKDSPEKYEPQYGGWCAYAMGSNGEKVEIDPETFKIVNGRLFLFYNKFFNNTLNDWNKNEKVLNTNADKNWSKTFK